MSPTVDNPRYVSERANECKSWIKSLTFLVRTQRREASIQLRLNFREKSVAGLFAWGNSAIANLYSEKFKPSTNWAEKRFAL